MAIEFTNPMVAYDNYMKTFAAGVKLVEAIGLALPGNGTIVATHENRTQLFKDAAKLIVENAMKYYDEGDESIPVSYTHLIVIPEGNPSITPPTPLP